MDPDSKKFGRGPRELTGAVDLISHYKLLSHHDFFCKRSLPLSISDTHYLHNVVGDTEIRKGEGMQLDQLIQDMSLLRETNVPIQPFDLDVLTEAFQLRETVPVVLPPSEKGTPAVTGKSKSKDKEKKHKKHKDKDREKDKEHKKHKHRHKDRSKDKEKEKKKDNSGHHDSGTEHSKKHHEKKRKHGGDEDINDIHKHKKSKHKSSKIDEMGAIKGSVSSIVKLSEGSTISVFVCISSEDLSLGFLKIAQEGELTC
ncbi:Mediator of RNA polymerase II transcription subunit 19a [Abeliophyllum distichum]|uniref:Mediator of RNA polymerase II transcription subunit 19a n=1 Tax=Abeliophyllum distichum TaxID=126358 RepID=A0ABD1VV18_9LAMI